MGAWTKPVAVQDWARRASERLGDIVEREVFGNYDLLLTPTVAGRPVKAGNLMKLGTVAAQFASLSGVVAKLG